MEKPKIFLSHITEEAGLATIFQEQIDASFLGMVEVFQSSDQKSLQVGRNWLDEITKALRNCEAIIVLCSPYSVRRPWINFECGAGWARDIEVVPICHSGLRPVDLPVPLSLLQGVDSADSSGLSRVFEMVAKKLGAQTPTIDTAALTARIGDFSKRYVEETEVYLQLRAIRSVSEEFLKALGQIQPQQVVPITGVPERLVERCRVPFEALQSRGHLAFSYSINGLSFAAPGSDGGGNYGTFTAQPSATMVAAVSAVLSE